MLPDTSLSADTTADTTGILVIVPGVVVAAATIVDMAVGFADWFSEC